MPGEKAHPTQPFVTKPPAYERQGVSIDDLIDFTPELRAEAVKLASRFKLGPIFTPPVVSKWDGPLATLMLPQRDRRRQLAGRLVRSGDRHLLHLHQHAGVSPRAGARRGASDEPSDMAYVRGQAPNPANPKAPAGAARRCRGCRWSSRRTAASPRSI